MKLKTIKGFWDVTDAVTLRECEEMAADDVDIRFENGRAYLPIYREEEL